MNNLIDRITGRINRSWEFIKNFNFDFIKLSITKIFKSKPEVILYTPTKIQKPSNLIQCDSAWKGLESIIEDIADRFELERNSCLEFGVEFGYSSVAFSNYFKSVFGVDTFQGDIHTKNKEDIYADTKERLKNYKNIKLIQADYKDFTKEHNKEFYDLVHVDIVHTYIDTFKCGLWSARHSKCVIFHDTESFKSVKDAVMDIAWLTNKKFYNYEKCNGLGILV